MSARRESVEIEKKPKEFVAEPAPLGEHVKGRQFSTNPHDVAIVEADQGKLRRDLKGRHMQMIAV